MGGIGVIDKVSLISKKDNLVKIYRNVGPEREGLTILYDFLVDNVATTDKLLFFHFQVQNSTGMEAEIAQ